ncbi:MAG: type II toxin-antitoxin system VapC family toxin [Chthoniobacteraceae bacterium]
MLLDANILIYLAQPGGEKLEAEFAAMLPATSLIARVEALGFQRITAEERGRFDQVFGWVEVLPVSDAVAEAAILLRQARRMKLGDALIAATALLYELPLVTRNVDDFKHIAGLEIVNPFVESEAD